MKPKNPMGTVRVTSRTGVYAGELAKDQGWETKGDQEVKAQVELGQGSERKSSTGRKSYVPPAKPGDEE